MQLQQVEHPLDPVQHLQLQALLQPLPIMPMLRVADVHQQPELLLLPP